ncbi:MAG: hypothetical protein IT492_05485 [Gammaproteobacteria bacterium]|nr:hypothetical protein [Gammaproteobacteria bacterium]
MRFAQALLLITAAFIARPSFATMFEYRFTGAITAATTGSFESPGPIALGDAFSGYWRVEQNQLGQPFSAPGFNSLQYDLDSVRIELDGETATLPGGFVSVSESVIDPPLLPIWPSGFSSDYVASVATVIPDHWGTTVVRTQIVFTYDGLGKWNNFALPGDYPFLDNALGGVLRMEASDGEIIGRIDTLVASTVPLPSSFVLLAAPFAMLAARRRKRARAAA